MIPWVDGSDPLWLKEKNGILHKDDVDDRPERYRDWDNLQYWFRGVEKFAPWVRKIHFITWGHLPNWLNIHHEKLHIVKHVDYIDAEFLPTYNCNVLETNMHKIEGLSEKFVYFNDDFFLTNYVKETDFFRNNLPCDMLALQPVVANPMSPMMSYIFQNNAMTLARHFEKRENMRKQPGAYWKIGYPFKYFGYNFLEMAFPLFTGFFTAHGPSPFLKSTFDEIWALEKDMLTETSRHKFRDKNDVSQYLFREWQKLSGKFVPTNVLKHFQYYNVESSNEKLLQAIKKQKYKCICINDANAPIEFEKAKKEINDAFEKILPEKSNFEI